MIKVEKFLLMLFLLAGVMCKFEEHLVSYVEMTPEERKKAKKGNKARAALNRLKKDTEKLNTEADDYFIYEAHRAANGSHIPYRKLNLSSVRRSIMVDHKAQLKRALSQNKIAVKITGSDNQAPLVMDSGLEEKPHGRVLATAVSPFTEKELDDVLGAIDVSKSFKKLIEKTKKAKIQSKVIKKINLS